MINKNYVYGILTLLFANPAYAALDCKQQPTCESLGYSKTVAANCPADGTIACPFDPSYKKCVVTATQSYDCATVGFTKSNKTTWCKNVIKCPIDQSYTLCKWLDCTALGFDRSYCPSGGICEECVADENATKKYKLTGCQSGYVFKETCYKTYASCTAANYYETNPGGCSTVSIYLNDGSKKTCYSCSSSSSSSDDGSSGGNTDLLGDCYEACADDCNQNTNNCAGYSACISNCNLNYGFNMEVPQTLLLAQTNKTEFKKLYTEALEAAQDEADCAVYI